jgi:hypothetical protein
MRTAPHLRESAKAGRRLDEGEIELSQRKEQ